MSTTITVELDGPAEEQFKRIRDARAQLTEMLKDVQASAPRRPRAKKAKASAETVDPNTFERDAPFTVQGQPGVFKFRRIDDKGTVHAFGGQKGREQSRSFAIDRNIFLPA